MIQTLLSLTILDEATAEPHAEAWAERLATTKGAKRLNLYTLYYDVRMELALRGGLTEGRRALLDDYATLYQTLDGDAAGHFTIKADKKTLQAWKQAKRQSAATGSDGWIARSGTTILTAFSVLTLEHALYRR